MIRCQLGRAVEIIFVGVDGNDGKVAGGCVDLGGLGIIGATVCGLGDILAELVIVTDHAGKAFAYRCKHIVYRIRGASGLMSDDDTGLRCYLHG